MPPLLRNIQVERQVSDGRRWNGLGPEYFARPRLSLSVPPDRLTSPLLAYCICLFVIKPGRSMLHYSQSLWTVQLSMDMKNAE